MKKLFLIAGLLLLSGCKIDVANNEGRKAYVKCWNRKNQQVVVFEGEAITGVGASVSDFGVPFLSFKTISDERVVIKLDDKICAIVAE